MSPTPRTDAALWRESEQLIEVVDADFARELERENAALREAMQSAVELLNGWQAGQALEVLKDALAGQGTARGASDA